MVRVAFVEVGPNLAEMIVSLHRAESLLNAAAIRKRSEMATQKTFLPVWHDKKPLRNDESLKKLFWWMAHVQLFL